VTTPLSDLIAEERGTDLPDEDLDGAGLARRWYLQGKRFEASTFEETTGRNRSVVSDARNRLMSLGFVFDNEIVPNPDRKGTGGRPRRAYWITNLDHEPTEVDYRNATMAKNPPRAKAKKAPAKKTSVPARATETVNLVAPQTTHNGVPMPALPGLGVDITVYAQVLNTDGSITLGLRNGTRQWMVNVTGVTEALSDGHDR
jgi:hypothetical protein